MPATVAQLKTDISAKLTGISEKLVNLKETRLNGTGFVVMDGATPSYKVQVDWNNDIANKPALQGSLSGNGYLLQDGVNTSFTTIANMQANWTEANTASVAYIKNKPAINDSTVTIKMNNTAQGTFSTNQASNSEINIVVPAASDAEITFQQNGTNFANNSFTIDQIADKTINIPGVAQRVSLSTNNGTANSITGADLPVTGVLSLANGGTGDNLSEDDDFGFAYKVGTKLVLSNAPPENGYSLLAFGGYNANNPASFNPHYITSNGQSGQIVMSGSGGHLYFTPFPQSNWDALEGNTGFIHNKPDIASILSRITNLETSTTTTIPGLIKDSTITLQLDGVNVSNGSFTLNQDSNKTINIQTETLSILELVDTGLGEIVEALEELA